VSDTLVRPDQHADAMVDAARQAAGKPQNTGPGDALIVEEVPAAGGDPGSTEDVGSNEEFSFEESGEETSAQTAAPTREPAKKPTEKPSGEDADDDLRAENDKLRGIVNKLASYPDIDKVVSFLEGKPIESKPTTEDPEVTRLAETMFGRDEEGNLKPGAAETVTQILSLAQDRAERAVYSKLAPHLQQNRDIKANLDLERGLRQAGLNPSTVEPRDFERFVSRFKKTNSWIKSVERDDPVAAGQLIGKAYRREQKKVREAAAQRSRVDDARETALFEPSGRGAAAGSAGTAVRINPSSRDFNLRNISRLLAAGKKIV
jgi:hypothetical protein